MFAKCYSLAASSAFWDTAATTDFLFGLDGDKADRMTVSVALLKWVFIVGHRDVGILYARST